MSHSAASQAPIARRPRVALARSHRRVQLLARERVLAHQHGLEEPDQRAGIGLRRIVGGAEESMALDAVIGPDAQQPEIAAARGVVRPLRIAGRRDVFPGEQG
jgi:hypothetical protein